MAIKILGTKPNDFLVGSNTVQCLTSNPCYQVLRNTAMGWTTSSKGQYYSGFRADGDFIFVYHAEKRRPKFKKEVTLFKSGASKGQVKTKTVTKVKEGCWKVRVFKFPTDRVVKVKQHARHFEITLK